jgi:tetratricopeptide (TPR) repeat protein
MASSLVRRFVVGHSDWPGPATPEGQLVYTLPERQQQLVFLARRQLAESALARHQVVESNLEGAELVASSIEHLEGALVQATSEAAKATIESIKDLGSLLSGGLEEIKWELTQSNVTLGGILRTLQQSRSNEAQQLLKQGIRHSRIGEYVEAEERFRLALSFDTTDFQVLMNLGFISLHKDDAAGAEAFFRKALRLPDALDADSRSHVLWTLARLHFAERQFPEAVSSAQEAQRSESNRALALYRLGVYTGLAGHVDEGIKLIVQAVATDRAFFALAASDVDATPFRAPLLSNLARLAKAEYSQTVSLTDHLDSAFSDLGPPAEALGFPDVVADGVHVLACTRAALRNPSYSETVAARNAVALVNAALEGGRTLKVQYEDLRAAEDGLRFARRNLTAFTPAESAALQPETPWGNLRRNGWWVCGGAWVMSAAAFLFTHAVGQLDALLGFVTVPLLALIVCSGVNESQCSALGLPLKLWMLAVGIAFAFWLAVYWRRVVVIDRQGRFRDATRGVVAAEQQIAQTRATISEQLAKAATALGDTGDLRAELLGGLEALRSQRRAAPGNPTA